jgi:hypothetical protein
MTETPHLNPLPFCKRGEANELKKGPKVFSVD